MFRTLTLAIVLCALCASCRAQEGSGSPWSIEEPLADIPDRALTGSVSGHEISEVSARANAVALTISTEERSNGWPVAEIVVFVDLRGQQDEWTVTPGSGGSPPHVHMKFVRPGDDFPSNLTFTGEYSMHLVVDERGDETVRGRIHLSLPDYKKSYLVGEFTASIEG